MNLQLYDLAGADAERRFSPYCWRVKMAIAHKGLTVDTIPWRFSDKEMIAFSGQGTVPVVIDKDKTISDSWMIANYLEDTYPDRPSLFGGPGGRAMARFVSDWGNAVVQTGIAKLIVADVHAHLHEKDSAYFRTSREQRFGKTLEEVCADRDNGVKAFRQSLQPLRATLDAQPFLGGDGPNYADYIIFGGFQWARVTSEFKLLEESDPLYAWRGRLLAAFDGMAAKAVGYAV